MSPHPCLSTLADSNYPLDNSEELEKEYSGKLQKKYDQPMHEVISSVFRGLSDRKITAPSAGFTRYPFANHFDFGIFADIRFCSRESHSSIRTSLKAAQGDLYFLEKGLLFLGKPVTHIEYNNISNAVFSR